MNADLKEIAKQLAPTQAEAIKALNRLPGIYQAIGGIAEAARRCKADSKRGKMLWGKHTDLGNEGAELMSKIRLALLAWEPDHAEKPKGT